MEHILLRYQGTVRELLAALRSAIPPHRLPWWADEVALYRMRRALREAERRSRAATKPPAA